MASICFVHLIISFFILGKFFSRAFPRRDLDLSSLLLVGLACYLGLVLLLNVLFHLDLSSCGYLLTIASAIGILFFWSDFVKEFKSPFIMISVGLAVFYLDAINRIYVPHNFDEFTHWLLMPKQVFLANHLISDSFLNKFWLSYPPGPSALLVPVLKVYQVSTFDSAPQKFAPLVISFIFLVFCKDRAYEFSPRNKLPRVLLVFIAGMAAVLYVEYLGFWHSLLVEAYLIPLLCISLLSLATLKKRVNADVDLIASITCAALFKDVALIFFPILLIYDVTRMILFRKLSFVTIFCLPGLSLFALWYSYTSGGELHLAGKYGLVTFDSALEALPLVLSDLRLKISNVLATEPLRSILLIFALIALLTAVLRNSKHHFFVLVLFFVTYSFAYILFNVFVMPGVGFNYIPLQHFPRYAATGIIPAVFVSLCAYACSTRTQPSLVSPVVLLAVLWWCAEWDRGVKELYSENLRVMYQGRAVTDYLKTLNLTPDDAIEVIQLPKNDSSWPFRYWILEDSMVRSKSFLMKSNNTFKIDKWVQDSNDFQSTFLAHFERSRFLWSNLNEKEFQAIMTPKSKDFFKSMNYNGKPCLYERLAYMNLFECRVPF